MIPYGGGNPNGIIPFACVIKVTHQMMSETGLTGLTGLAFAVNLPRMALYSDATHQMQLASLLKRRFLFKQKSKFGAIVRSFAGDPRTVAAMAEIGARQAFVFRISPEDEWAAAQAAGVLRGGQLDTTSGYIHLSTAGQVAGTLALFYAGRSDLFLLKVNASKLGDGLRYDEVEGVGLFPHFYGPDGASFTPLPLSAVEASAKIELEKGMHVLPVDLINN